MASNSTCADLPALDVTGLAAAVVLLGGLAVLRLRCLAPQRPR